MKIIDAFLIRDSEAECDIGPLPVIGVYDTEEKARQSGIGKGYCGFDGRLGDAIPEPCKILVLDDNTVCFIEDSKLKLNQELLPVVAPVFKLRLVKIKTILPFIRAFEKNFFPLDKEAIKKIFIRPFLAGKQVYLPAPSSGYTRVGAWTIIGCLIDVCQIEAEEGV